MRIMSSFGHTLLLFVCIVLAGLASAAAHVTTLRIDRVEPFAAHATFGDTGAYERVIGIARGELDPADPRNELIVGIDRAPRNAAGMVEYETDLFILRPVDPAKGNHQLLFDVLNRGNKVVTNRLNRTMPEDDSNDPSTSAHAGDGFLFRRGYTIAWAGWDPDSPKANAGMTIRIPALQDVERDIRDEFVSATRGPPLTQFKLSYAAASPNPATARLTMRAGGTLAQILLAWTALATRSLLDESAAVLDALHIGDIAEVGQVLVAGCQSLSGLVAGLPELGRGRAQAGGCFVAEHRVHAVHDERVD
jgi:hypothetical protein